MRVFVYSARVYDQSLLEQTNENHELFFTEERLTIDTAGYAEGYDAVSVFTCDDGSAPVLERLRSIGVKYLTLRSSGYDHVDIKKAEALGMIVANVPLYSPYATAEHAVALLMSLNRRIIDGQLLIRLQDFRLDGLTGFDLHGKTVGIIGTGNNGMAFARIMNGFGTRLLGYDPVENPDADEVEMQYVELETLLKDSDIISVHCPLNASTRYMLAAPQFAIMKNNCILINIAHGAIIKTEDLITALESGTIGGACLDVYEHENGLFFEDHRQTLITDVQFKRLLQNRNVIITCHQGFLTREALEGIAKTTIMNLDLWQCGDRSIYEITARHRYFETVRIK